MFKEGFYIVAAINNTVNVDHRFTSAGWMIQDLKTFYKCWMEDADLKTFSECWMEDADLKTLSECWMEGCRF